MTTLNVAVGEYIESLSISELKALVSQLIDRMVVLTSCSSIGRGCPHHQTKRRCSNRDARISIADRRKLLSGKYMTSSDRWISTETSGSASVLTVSSSSSSTEILSGSDDSTDHHSDKERHLHLLSTVAQSSAHAQLL